MCSRRISRRGPPSSRPIEMEGWSGWWGVLAGISGSVRGRDVWKDGVLGLLILAFGDCAVCEKLVGRKKIHPPLSSSTHTVYSTPRSFSRSAPPPHSVQSLRSHPHPTPSSRLRIRPTRTALRPPTACRSGRCALLSATYQCIRDGTRACSAGPLGGPHPQTHSNRYNSARVETGPCLRSPSRQEYA